jgi:hypothetical protein
MISEESFIHTFIVRNRRGRLLYELADPKKRHAALDRFCHSSADLLDPKHIVCTVRSFKEIPAEFLNQEECVILSPDPSFDQKKMTFAQALEEADLCFDAMILLSKPYCAVKEESPGNIFLLK